MSSIISEDSKVIVERFVCEHCENRGLCTLETIIFEGYSQYELYEQGVSIYDAFSVLLEMAKARKPA